MDSVADLREAQELEGHADRVWSLAWNPAPHNCDGASAMLASCSGDRQDLANGSHSSVGVLGEFHHRTLVGLSSQWRTNAFSNWKRSHKRLPYGVIASLLGRKPKSVKREVVIPEPDYRLPIAIFVMFWLIVLDVTSCVVL
ncbi:putative cytosolic iron-sulfur protein assembly protein CIAO1 [Carex littledalei]|uniref:Putative cytosolic iron-sulfur protein assembly protein CIAO1 n=1 Tax=Carex littledalei TaxID=544730 RepID=A0A833QXI2_9POAL|nr:putative cytosolic iron-sulfur protein assembly protein CIAO1 [Carex littledalei]